MEVPYDSIRTVFLDMGNTLVSFDFEWVRDELHARGISCSVEELEWAEAAARPEVSHELERLGSTEGESTFRFYLGSMLSHLPCRIPSSRAETVLGELVSVLGAPGATQRLWSRVLPGVHDALERLQQAGLQLAVLSNSDGTVESGLAQKGLRRFFDEVIDSRVVGFEKPDPRLFLHALSVCRAAADCTLHLGDLYHVDVVAARATGNTANARIRI